MYLYLVTEGETVSSGIPAVLRAVLLLPVRVRVPFFVGQLREAAHKPPENDHGPVDQCFNEEIEKQFKLVRSALYSLCRWPVLGFI